jgi:23S rRNA (pseudouridine1915-N3)-methyltransferase
VIRFEVVEVRDEPLRHRAPSEVLQREAARIAPHLDGFVVISLDRDGDAITSTGLANLVDRLRSEPPGRAAFVIGGAVGLDQSILAAGRARVSLGAITLPHQLARVVLAEQLYRATTILRGEPYHH